MTRKLWQSPCCQAAMEYKDTVCPECGEGCETEMSDVEPYDTFDDERPAPKKPHPPIKERDK